MEFWKKLFQEKEKKKEEEQARLENLRAKSRKSSVKNDTPRNEFKTESRPLTSEPTPLTKSNPQSKNKLSFHEEVTSPPQQILRKDSQRRIPLENDKKLSVRLKKGFSILMGKKESLAFQENLNEEFHLPNVEPTRIFTTEEAQETITKEMRSFLAQKRFKHYTKSTNFTMERKRLDTVKEIFSSEVFYQSQLNTVYSLFYKPLKEKKLIPQDKLDIIFGNFESIREANDKLFTDLKEEYKKQYTNPRLGNIFRKNIDSLRAYSKYIINYDAALTELEKQEKRNRPLVAFFDKVHENPECSGLNFRSYLIIPVQRIPKYQLLLSDLYDRTPNDHVDYEDVEFAFHSMMQIVHEANEGKRNDESQSILADLQDFIVKNGNSIKYRKVLLTRKIVFHGVLQVAKEVYDSEGLQNMPLIGCEFLKVFLLDDLLFMVPTSITTTVGEMEKFMSKCDLIHLLFVEIRENRSNTFRITGFVRNEVYLYEFTAASEKLASTWLKHLQTQVGKVISQKETKSLEKLPMNRYWTKLKYSQIEKDFSFTESDYLDLKKRFWTSEKQRREHLFEMSLLQEELDNLEKERSFTMKMMGDIETHLSELRSQFQETDFKLREMDKLLFAHLNSETDVFTELFLDIPVGIEGLSNIPFETMKSYAKKSHEKRLSEKKSSSVHSFEGRKSMALSDEILRKQGLYFEDYSPSTPTENDTRRRKVTKSLDRTLDTSIESDIGSPGSGLESKRGSESEYTVPPPPRFGSLIESLRSKKMVSEASPTIEEKLKKDILASLPTDPLKLQEILTLLKK